MKKLVMPFILFGFLSMNVSFSLLANQKRSIVVEGETTNDLCRSHLIRFCARHCASVVLSGCVGAMTGGLVRYGEKQLDIESSPMVLFFLLLTWSLESEFRNEVIGMLQKDFNTYGIGLPKGLMYKTAWIASWMAYLSM